MKFPINVTSKKTHKHSVNDENDKNKANVIHSVEEKISTEQKTTSVLLQGPKSQWSTAVPEMVRATTASEMVPAATAPEIMCAMTTSEPVCTSAALETVCVATGPEIVYEQGQKDINTPSEITSEDISCERRGSVVDEGMESSADNFEEEDEEVRRCSRASSVYDDSGFNSSTSEDRDDISLSSVNYDCDYEDEGDEQMLVLEDEDDNQNAHTCSNSMLENDKVLSVSKENVQRTENVCSNTSSEMRTLSEVSSESKSDTSVVSEQGDRIELHLNSSKSILARNSVRNSRRQRTDVTNAAATTVSSVAHPRTTRRRRTRDCNNNVTSKDFRSYLLRPPFRLGDCFQDMGILSLVVCIVYMLFLAMVCAVLGLLADAVKSFFGKKEVKDMRGNNVQSSRRRSPVSCG